MVYVYNGLTFDRITNPCTLHIVFMKCVTMVAILKLLFWYWNKKILEV